MKYFLDTEFHEYKKKPLLGKPIDTIELISIGIVSDGDEVNDSREYYAICKEFDIKAAWNNEWLRKNTLTSIWAELTPKYYIKGIGNLLTYREFKYLINKYGKTRKQIAKEIEEFVGTARSEDRPEFYAYYADYDWVLFCWLFGRMIDLPKEFPMYCKDLKQMMDDKRIKDPKGKLVGIQSMKSHPNYPKQTNVHNALEDAKWDKKLYEFLIKI